MKKNPLNRTFLTEQHETITKQALQESFIEAEFYRLLSSNLPIEPAEHNRIVKAYDQLLQQTGRTLKTSGVSISQFYV